MHSDLNADFKVKGTTKKLKELVVKLCCSE